MGINRSIKPTDEGTLRLNAEGAVAQQKQKSPTPSKLASQKLVHELEVYQVELEMQNDHLRQFQGELELSRNMSAELFDFAPVAYIKFDAGGIIRKINNAGAELLNIEKGLLVNVPFSRFIVGAEEKSFFSNHLTLVLKRKVMLKCAIKINACNGPVIHCQLQSLAVANSDGETHILTSIVDVSIRKQFEEMQQKAKDNLESMVAVRTEQLNKANEHLLDEILGHKASEESLKAAYEEIIKLKDRLNEENVYLQQEVNRQYNFGGLIGQSSILSRVFLQIEQVAPMNATVLLLGETGTGKGVVARAIHSSSPRKGRALITVDCTTLPATLVESELFGRERGAYTGSDTRQIGRFELADGGTIFLDEIGELPLDLQSKLLRVIQDGEFERLGSPKTYKTDVRIIAASNRNLAEEVKNGTFREDLYYRLNVFPITMPPLRLRKDDIPLLVNHFVAKFNQKIGKKVESISKDTLHALQEYRWPGNVRELESVIERAVIISQGNSLQILDRFDSFKRPEEETCSDDKSLVELEHDHILQVLKKTRWRIEGKDGAAILLGLNASTLRARMRKYGIVRA